MDATWSTSSRSPPAADRSEGWLLAHGYLVDGGRVSWTNIIESLKFAVVRFDTRLADTCAACAHTWLRALTCVLRCDENLNHRCCEHVVAVRHMLKDPDCDLSPSILTAPVGIGRPPDQPALSSRDKDIAVDRCVRRLGTDAAPLSPTQRPTAAEELRAEENSCLYRDMHACMELLRKPPLSCTVEIETRSNKKVMLLDGGRAIRTLADLTTRIEALRLERQASWNWEETATTLRMPGVLGCYVRHPNSTVASRASEAMDALRRSLHVAVYLLFVIQT